MRPPSVDSLARSLADTGLPHPLLVDAARAAIAAGDPGSARQIALASSARWLGPVVNATGVLLHTNLGRAPLEAAHPVTYSNLELDLATGRRGSRQEHSATLLARVVGAEAGLVVNNGASAVLLALAALAAGRGVAVSRGELVEIGGGFRIPEVMEQSGARLVEVGTTNRTRASDYAAAAEHGDIALVLKVHRSNYTISGFTEEATIEEVARIGVPVVFDVGSGLLDESTPWLREGPPEWLRGEPAVKQALAAGAALAIFSGDKLLGGPQAGVILGRSELVAACSRHPLYRALRPGGLVLRSLQDVALAYLRRDGTAIPFWKMATLPVEQLRSRAEHVAALNPAATVVDTEAIPGGGTLPGASISSAGVALPGDATAELRAASPPIVARVENDRTVLDMRTVLPDQDGHVGDAVASVAGDARASSTPPPD